MDFREAKKIIAYARRQGIKSLSLGDLKVDFHDAVIFPTKRKPRLVSGGVDQSIPAPPPDPTLEQINQFIYNGPELGLTNA